MKIILLGAPGAGKGTQATCISETYSIPTISTGNMLRAAIAARTPAGLEANSYMEGGNLVPDEIVVKILQDRLKDEDCKDGFILDGFPRTISQAETLDAMGVQIDKVLSIEVPDEAIVERLSGRRVCLSCGATFHTSYKPSRKGELCDVCEAPLVRREDDEPATVLKRLEVYHSKTEELKEYYLAKGLLRIVIGQEDVADTTRETLKALED